MRRLPLLVATAMTCFFWAKDAQAEKFNPACTSVPRHLWLSLQALETKVEAQGYKVHKSKLTSTCAAFEALNKGGTRFELFVDPTNGEIVSKVLSLNLSAKDEPVSKPLM